MQADAYPWGNECGLSRPTSPPKSLMNFCERALIGSRYMAPERGFAVSRTPSTTPAFKLLR